MQLVMYILVLINKSLRASNLLVHICIILLLSKDSSPPLHAVSDYKWENSKDDWKASFFVLFHRTGETENKTKILNIKYKPGTSCLAQTRHIRNLTQKKLLKN